MPHSRECGSDPSGTPRRIYLDHNATAPLHPAVLAAMLPCLQDCFGNPSSAHRLGRAARNKVEEAREQVAALIGAHPSEIVFCSGGTESDNMALKGAAWERAVEGRRKIAVSAIEHPAVLNTARSLAKNGFHLSVVGVDGEGIVHPGTVEQEMDHTTAVVSVMHANNEVGTIQPIGEIAHRARSRGILTHTDAVQSLGKIPVNVEELGVDLLSVSAHKIGGPKGVGALFVRRGVSLHPLITGGHHERGRRAGTENVPGIIGFGKACEIAGEALSRNAARMAALRDRLEREILHSIPHARLNGHRENRLPNTLNVGFSGADGESLLIRCDLEGIAVSSGAACSSGAQEPSHVLTAMGVPHEAVRGSLRFSLGPDTAQEDVDRVSALLPGMVELVRSLARK